MRLFGSRVRCLFNDFATDYADTMLAPVPDSVTPKLPAAKTAAELATELRAHPAYKALSAAGKKRADEILAFAEKSSNGAYYLGKLKLLLNTPNAKVEAATERGKSEVAASVKAAKDKNDTEGLSWGQRIVARIKRRLVEGEEEVIATDPSRHYETLKSQGATFQIDRRDPKNIVARVKVHVEASADMVSQLRTLEDSIEKHVRIQGFTVDLIFVDKPGPDVYSVKADPAGWTTSRNWVGRHDALAHEMLHLLGLDDEYDYIESHAANAFMDTDTRLYWFTVEMKRKRPEDGARGIMSYHGQKMLDRHACEVAQLGGTTDALEKCVETRTGSPYKLRYAEPPKTPSATPPVPRSHGHAH